jgi:hypothetical protein
VNMNRLVRDCRGSSLVEFTLVFPILILITFGTIDVTYMLYEWNLASKAAYRGARVAIVANPVAPEITNPAYNVADIGLFCFNRDTGASTGLCPTVSVTCPSADGCPDPDNAAFTFILQEMQQIFPRLQAANVSIHYETTGLGFVGRPGGLPMNVTVSIRCMTHQLFFFGRVNGMGVSGAPQPVPGIPTRPGNPCIRLDFADRRLVGGATRSLNSTRNPPALLIAFFEGEKGTEHRSLLVQAPPLARACVFRPGGLSPR